MSTVETSAAIAAIVGAVVAVVGCAWHVRWMFSLPFKGDVATAKGSASKGVMYAYTLGMAPWEKESTRRHMVGYLRGVLFHVGIFAALVVFVASPWATVIWPSVRLLLAAVACLGGIAGLLGLAARFGEHNLRAISTKDDYFAVALVNLFVLTSALAVLSPSAVPVFYVVSAVTLVYLPFGKVRHCVYFFFSRFAFGVFFGHRGVIEGARSQ